MSFNGAFTVVPVAANPQQMLITDTSTGSDSNLTDRRITLYLTDGTTLTPQGSSTPYIDWPIASGPITITVLTKDYSLNVNVQWISSSPLAPPSTYTLSILKTFTENTELGDYGISQMMAANKLLAQDDHFLDNKVLLRLYIDNANNATNYNDQFNAQSNLNDAYNLITNLSTYFN